MDYSPSLLYARRHWDNLVIVPLACAIFGSIAFWALIYDRQPPIVLSEGKVSPQKVAPGELITTTWQVTVNRSNACQSIAYRDIVDGQHVAWTVALHPRMPNQIGTYSRHIAIPNGAAPGKATYRLRACYSCTGISLTRIFPVCTQWPDLPFEIVAPTQQP